MGGLAASRPLSNDPRAAVLRSPSSSSQGLDGSSQQPRPVEQPADRRAADVGGRRVARGSQPHAQRRKLRHRRRRRLQLRRRPHGHRRLPRLPARRARAHRRGGRRRGARRRGVRLPGAWPAGAHGQPDRRAAARRVGHAQGHAAQPDDARALGQLDRGHAPGVVGRPAQRAESASGVCVCVCTARARRLLRSVGTRPASAWRRLRS